jgi:hypothetical protein
LEIAIPATWQKGNNVPKKVAVCPDSTPSLIVRSPEKNSIERVSSTIQSHGTRPSSPEIGQRVDHILIGPAGPFLPGLGAGRSFEMMLCAISARRRARDLAG